MASSVSVLLAVEKDRVNGTVVRLAAFSATKLKQCDNCHKWKPESTFPFHVYRKKLRSKCTCSERCTQARAGQKAAYRSTASGKAAFQCADKTERRKQLRRERDSSDWGKAVLKDKKQKAYANPMVRMISRIRTRARRMGERKSTSKTILRWVGQDGQAKLSESLLRNPDHEIDHRIAIFWYMWKIEGDKIVKLESVDVDALMRCWHIDNLQLVPRDANRRKSYTLIPDEELLSLRHCWPSWWHDKLPSATIRSMNKHAQEYELDSCGGSESESESE